MLKRLNNIFLFSLAKAFEGSPVMVTVATLGVVISVMVMVVAVTVVDGFNHEIERKVEGMAADYNIISYGSGAKQGATFYRDTELEKSVKEAGFEIYPYLNSGGLARRGSDMAAVMLKGLENKERAAFFEEYLTEGRMPLIEGDKRVREIIISNELSRKFGISSGDRLEIVFMEEPPLRELYDVVGVYNTAIGTFDKGLIVASIDNTRYIEEVDSEEIGGYEVLYSGDKAEGYDKLSDIVDGEFGDNGLMVRSTREDYPQIFSWLGLQQSNELVVITIMLVVVIINVVSLLLILLLNNIYQIGVLTVLGMGIDRIRKVFMINSLKIVLRAMFIGNITIIALLMIQKEYKIIKLDPEGYSVDSVPIFFEWGEIAFLNLVIVAVLLLFQWITTLFVGKIEPTNVLKYEKR